MIKSYRLFASLVEEPSQLIPKEISGNLKKSRKESPFGKTGSTAERNSHLACDQGVPDDQSPMITLKNRELTQIIERVNSNDEMS